MKRIFCWFGFHKWRNYGFAGYGRCARCNLDLMQWIMHGNHPEDPQ